MIPYYYDSLLLDKNKNIYASFVKFKDLKNKNFGLRTPPIKLHNREILIGLTKKKFGNFDNGFRAFIIGLEQYLGIKYSSVYKTKYRYLQLFKKNKINLVFLRVITICLSKNIEDSIKLFNLVSTKKGVIYIDKVRFNTIKFNKRTFYLAGVIVGDGHLDKGETELTIADGQSNKDNLWYSEKYLLQVNKLLKNEFNLSGHISFKNRWYTLRIGSKWLCRYFNYYFDIPFGKKCDIVRLAKITSNENERFFWRGLMDTDGYIRKNRKQICIVTKSYNLMNDLRDFYLKNNIFVSVKKEPNVYSLRIFAEDILKYSKLVGFSHPRKMNLLKDYLKEGPRYNVLKCVNKKIRGDVALLFNYLRPYKENVYVKLDIYNRKSNKISIRLLLEKIRKTFNVEICEIKRNRLNNHFYIYSKDFSKFLYKNAKYGLPWQSLNNHQIKQLEESWSL